MTDLLFQTDSYLQEFEARVTGIQPEARAVILDKTAFYPSGGGQPCDFGVLTIDGVSFPVTSVKKQGADVSHFLGGEASLPSAAGAAAHGKIDWARRHKLMRTHTALHVLCGTVFRDYGALVTGGDMEPLKGRMDFEFERMRAELVREIEAAVNREIEVGRDTRVKILPRAEAAGPHCGNRGAGLAGGRRDSCPQYVRGRAHPCDGLQEQGRHQQTHLHRDRVVQRSDGLFRDQPV
jgi:misacylated tRNA(Ala) deacylase